MLFYCRLLLFTRATLCVSAVFATEMCLSVRPSVCPSVCLSHRRRSIGVHGVRTPPVFGLVVRNKRGLCYGNVSPKFRPAADSLPGAPDGQNLMT